MPTPARRSFLLRCSLLISAFACAFHAAFAPAATAPDRAAGSSPLPAAHTAARTHELRPAEVLAELKRGGYVLYFRHTSTDFSQDDSKSRGPDDCVNQRNLTVRGRDEARAIGAAIRALDIPIGSVLASPVCRTMETARLAFGRAEASAAVRGGPANDADRYSALRQLLAAERPRGANVVIASHGNPFYAVAGPPYLAEGEAAVIRGLGADKFEIVGRISRDGWAALAPRSP